MYEKMITTPGENLGQYYFCEQHVTKVGSKMSTKQKLKASFAVDRKHEAFYTGGKVQTVPDGSHVLCRCSEKVNLVDIGSGSVVSCFGKEGEGEVSSYVLSPDSKLLVIALRNLLLKQWDFENKTLSRTWKAIHTSPVNTMSFDSTSTLLATGGADATIKVWDVIQQYCTHNLKGHQGVITVTAFHPDTDKLQLFSAGEDYNIRVWDLKTSTCVHVLEGHFSAVTSLQFSGDHLTMYSGGRDRVVHVWDLFKHVKTKTIPVYETVESVVLLGDDGDHSELNVTSKSPHFVTAGSKGLLRVWNADSATCVLSQSNGIGGLAPADQEDEADEEAGTVITDATYCPTTDTISVVSYDHNIYLYNRKDLSLQKQFAGYNDEVLDIKFLGPEQSHLVVVTNSELIKVFELSSWSVQILRGHTDTVLGLDVYQSGTMFASSSKDNTIRLWSLDTDTWKVGCLAAGYGHTNEILTVAFSKLSESFLVSGSRDLTLKMWSLPSEHPTDGAVSLTSKATEKAHDKDINSVVVSPNDKLVATGSQDKTAKLWSAEGLKPLGVFRGHRRGIWCVQFSPVDQCIATASSDCTVKIWTLMDFSCVKTFEGHDALVLKVSFISRGMQLLTCGSDGLLKLWTIKNNECVKTFDEHTDRVWALAVNRDEDLVVTGAGDSAIVVWKDVTDIELEEQRSQQVDIILKEQKLLNFLQKKKYLKALALAITMEQPFRALGIVRNILDEAEGLQGLETTLSKLRNDQLDAVLRFSVEWNTNSKHCHVAQTVLSTILRTQAPEDVLKLPNARTALEGLVPYTEKHLARLTRLQQQAMFVDYTWQVMRLAAGEAVDEITEPLGLPDTDINGTTKTPDLSTLKHINRSDSESDSDSDSDQDSTIDTKTSVQRKTKNVTSSSDSSDLESGEEMRAETNGRNLQKMDDVEDDTSDSDSEDSDGMQFVKKRGTAKRKRPAPDCKGDIVVNKKLDQEQTHVDVDFDAESRTVFSDKENQETGAPGEGDVPMFADFNTPKQIKKATKSPKTEPRQKVGSTSKRKKRSRSLTIAP